MRTWQRAIVDTLCGGPCKGTLIRKGDPVQLVSTPGLARRLARCRHCADGDVPTDLPALAAPTPITPTALVRFAPGYLPLDFKMAAAGREPGSDDE